MEKVISIASAEVGYLEKKNNAQLDSKTANAGSKNYTKYNRDYITWGYGGTQPMQWCGAFVSWLFVKAYGLEEAKNLLCGGLFHYTPTGASRFKNKGRYIKRGSGLPMVGDVVFFYSSEKGRIGHVGIVYKVDEKKVYTIEGNTSGANTLITNGGGVKRKSYKLTSTYIDGYGRPAYDDTNYEKEKVCSVDVRVLRNGFEGEDVKALQMLLIGYGYEMKNNGKSYGADGAFGKATESAVKDFQEDYRLSVDGIVGEKTWSKLLGV